MTPRPLYSGQQIDPARAAALNKLHMTIGEALEDGAEIPCIADPDTSIWISEHRADQDRAAGRCLDCDCFLQCLEYRRAWPERGAVFAGELPTPTPGRKRT